ncbi:MAG: glycerophosphodiester phosphodiesterase family protein [Clostridia bacterium]
MTKANNTKVPYKHYPAEIVNILFNKRKVYDETVQIEKKDTLMIAHRGLSKIEKENTIPAFRLAGEHSYYGIECDVHRSKDGRYFIIHDENTKRVSGEDCIIEESTAERIRNIYLRDISGNASERYIIPTLIEYIMTCQKFNKVAVVEFKNHFEEEHILEMCEIIDSENCLCTTVFISFDLENLLAVRRKYPDQPVQYLSSRYHEGILELLKENKMDLDIYHRELTKEKLDLLHENGIKVNVWTVDDKKTAEKYADWGVDYITTNILE